ncbi:MAG TPA: hypothetical protein VIV60_18625, partial [Polyangiaceae bacterium]
CLRGTTHAADLHMFRRSCLAGLTLFLFGTYISGCSLLSDEHCMAGTSNANECYQDQAALDQGNPSACQSGSGCVVGVGCTYVDRANVALNETRCHLISNPALCTADRGCAWQPRACLGKRKFCSLLREAECVADPDCLWGDAG